jgi:CSLREA domain-containing protein
VDANPGNGVCETASGNGVCTLRAAIQEANALAGEDTIILPPNTYLLTQVTELIIIGNLTITGGGASTTIIDGNRGLRSNSGVLVINVGFAVNLSGVTIRNGGRMTSAGDSSGGGIINSGMLTLNNSTVNGNSASIAGGGINNFGTVTLNNSTVSGNSATFVGGGIFNSSGTLTLNNSTVNGNSASINGGGITNVDTVTLTNSTVSGNRAEGDGGGIQNIGTSTLTSSTVSGNSAGGFGGGILNGFGGTLTLTNSTVSGNSAGGFGGGINNFGTADFFNSTIRNNRSDANNDFTGTGGGVSNHSGGTFNFQNTIIADNFDTFFGINDCAGTLTSVANNLITTLMATIPPGCSIVGSPVTIAPPLLGPLQNNGGPTQTHAPLAGSPAIDGGNPGGCRDQFGALLTSDQRGSPRTVDSDGNGTAICDIGAFEADANTSTAVLAAVLPSSRSVRVGVQATAFATIINVGSQTAEACGITLLTSIPVIGFYQTTNPVTNQLTGSPNTPVDIPARAAQSFVVAFTPTQAFAPTDAQMSFDCDNTIPAPINTGLNTLLLSASATPVPDIVALAVTPSNDGIVTLASTGVFAVATVNVGATGTITASADTGSAALPVNISLCETNPATGQCISAIGPGVTTQINANATPTFGIFVEGNGIVPFDPAANRIFVRFRDAGDITRGSTSVAVRTQ